MSSGSLSVKQMSSIGELMSQSWDTFKKSWLHLFVFNLVAVVVLVVLIVVGVLLSFASGVGVAFSAQQQQNVAFTSGLVLLAFLVIGLVFLVLLIVWSYIVAAGDVLIVSNNGDISLDQTIKRSFSFVRGLFFVGIVAGFLIFGNFLAFIIPGIVYGLLFSFYAYEIILDGKSGLDALRSSIAIVSQNFWGILGRSLFIGVIGFVLIFGVSLFSAFPTMLGKDSAVGIVLTLLFFLVRIVVQIGFTFFNLAYTYTMYRQAKEAAVEKEGSLKIPTILAIVGFVIFFLLIANYGSAIGKAMQQYSAQQKNATKSTNYLSPSSSFGKVDASVLQQPVSLAINAYRQKTSLPAIQEDSQLCAYAQRRLEQLTAYGKWDDAKGFYEDTANPQIVKAYFPNVSNINEEAWDPVTATTTPEAVVAGWSNRKKGTGILPNAEYTSGCVRGSGQFLVFIASSSK